MHRCRRCAATGPPIPDDGLSIEIVGNGTELRPVAGLPAIRDADVVVTIVGRKATVSVGRGSVELSPGHKLAITNGVFEVPDTFPTAPPTKVRFRIDGPVQAAAELLALDRLREFSGSPLDPATSRGLLSAQVALGSATQGRSAAGLIELHHQHRRLEFRRRAHGDDPEGGGRNPARGGQQ